MKLNLGNTLEINGNIKKSRKKYLKIIGLISFSLLLNLTGCQKDDNNDSNPEIDINKGSLSFSISKETLTNYEIEWIVSEQDITLKTNEFKRFIYNSDNIRKKIASILKGINWNGEIKEIIINLHALYNVINSLPKEKIDYSIALNQLILEHCLNNNFSIDNEFYLNKLLKTGIGYYVVYKLGFFSQGLNELTLSQIKIDLRQTIDQLILENQIFNIDKHFEKNFSAFQLIQDYILLFPDDDYGYDLLKDIRKIISTFPNNQNELIDIYNNTIRALSNKLDDKSKIFQCLDYYENGDEENNLIIKKINILLRNSIELSIKIQEWTESFGYTKIGEDLVSSNTLDLTVYGIVNFPDNLLYYDYLSKIIIELTKENNELNLIGILKVKYKILNLMKHMPDILDKLESNNVINNFINVYINGVDLFFSNFFQQSITALFNQGYIIDGAIKHSNKNQLSALTESLEYIKMNPDDDFGYQTLKMILNHYNNDKEKQRNVKNIIWNFLQNNIELRENSELLSMSFGYLEGKNFEEKNRSLIKKSVKSLIKTTFDKKQFTLVEDKSLYYESDYDYFSFNDGTPIRPATTLDLCIGYLEIFQVDENFKYINDYLLQIIKISMNNNEIDSLTIIKSKLIYFLKKTSNNPVLEDNVLKLINFIPIEIPYIENNLRFLNNPEINIEQIQVFGTYFERC